MNNYIKTFTYRFSAFFLALVACLSIQNLQAQDSKGTEFWICIPGNISSPQPQLYITSTAASTVTINIPGLGFSQVVNVAAGTLQTVNPPITAQVQTQFVAENKGIHITATTEVTVYCMNAQTATTDAFLAFPLDAIGTQYYVLGYNKDFSFPNPTQATIVATQNNTTVTITPTLTEGGFTAGVPRNIVLQQGQVYQLRSNQTNADYSGTRITADKRISVYGGAQCTNISGNLRACDHLVEQLPPLSSWGRSFVTVPLETRTAGDVFRFLAQTNGSQISVNGSVVTTLNAGQFHEMILGSNTYNRITSNQPILVGQYSRSSDADGVTSDPFFSLVPPDEQFLNTYTISAGTNNVPINYLNITSPTPNTATVRVDGVVVNPALWAVIPGTNFSGAQVQVANGIHTVSSSLPIGLLVYGFGSFDSYGYLGGQSFSAVATVTTLTLTPETGSAATGTNQCFNARVTDQFGVVVTGVRVDFAVTGANPSTSFAFTNANGIAQLCYSGSNAGTDNITASVGTITDRSTFTWTAVQTDSIFYSKATGDLHNRLTWGLNPDGSGQNPADFNDSVFQLANRGTNYMMTGNWTVGGTLSRPAGSSLRINGYTLSVARLAGTGTFAGSATSNLIVAGNHGGNIGPLNFTAGSGSLKNLTINRTGAGAAASIGTPLSIYDVLTITSGALNTGNNITLKSNATNTARVAPITGSITGNVTVERYIPARRAWRLMNAPVNGNQTINAAWQEGATTSSANPNPNPGFGTHITQGRTNGLDFNPHPLSAMSSLKTYNSVTNVWVPVTNTISTTVGNKPFMIFIRGDRGIKMFDDKVPPNNTVLRATGPLKVGNQTFPVAANGFTAVPNPFASPINYATITRNNVQNNFYLWDPKMGGTYGKGAYVNVSFNGTSYDVTPASVSPESQYIQSGQSFLVHSTGVAGSIVIKESDKSNTAATNVFGVNPEKLPAVDNAKGLRISLQTVNPDNSYSLLDEVYSSYGVHFSDKVDEVDALKMDNIEENLAIVNNGQKLMVERRSKLNNGDIIYLNTWNTSARTYLFEFNPINISTSGLSATLIDKYLNTTTPISTKEPSQVYFTVTPDAASGSSDRFMVIFSSGNAQPLITGKTRISVYPNPVAGRTINLQISNGLKGVYQVELINSVGKVVLRRTIQHQGGTAVQTVPLNKPLAKGAYMLRTRSKDVDSTVTIISPND